VIVSEDNSGIVAHYFLLVKTDRLQNLTMFLLLILTQMSIKAATINTFAKISDIIPA